MDKQLPYDEMDFKTECLKGVDFMLDHELAVERMIGEGGAVSEGYTYYPRSVDGGKVPERRNNEDISAED
ncbi:hypothetical protein [Lederbergia lenta]|uniref:Uncharacterized protein n=1 Tax=Lederbergia lenta TaxID=1467 RepID=A0A2X4VXP4_LEDLE|nr:hypothetical protein [Lederbergia lenta]MCM3113260.1 hypothetical protein [Lederbergia lenta]MEC2326397.1 hypothetical protein [Lederbergia lenta]SQI51402.1 Uncharacterised protein [Lederbergia lenta]